MAVLRLIPAHTVGYNPKRSPTAIGVDRRDGAFYRRRIVSLVPVIVLVSIGAFSFIHLLPGDPVIALLGTGGQSLSPQQLKASRHDLGVGPAAAGTVPRLGRQGAYRRPRQIGRDASDDHAALRDRFPVTLQITLASFLVSLAIALPTGIIAAYRRNSLLDRVMTVFALGGVAMPASGSASSSSCCSRCRCTGSRHPDG